MSEYVERAALMGKLTAADMQQKLRQMSGEEAYSVLLWLVNAAPAADVAPVVHGEWAPSEGNPGFLVCSACGDCYVVDEWADGKKWRYCPACGAKMDGKGEDDGQKD